MSDDWDSGNELVMTWGRDDGDGIGELSVHARSGGFGGVGRAWFDRETVADFAESLSQFPIEADSPVLSGGYGDPADYDEYVGIGVSPVGRRGQLGVDVHLVRDDKWTGARLPEGRHEVRLHLPTTYERLAAFGGDLIAVLDGQIAQAVLGEERLT